MPVARSPFRLLLLALLIVGALGASPATAQAQDPSDRDGDGVHDGSADLCPDQPGPADFQGCTRRPEPAVRAYFPRQLGLGVGAEGSPKYVALIATRCILGPTNLGCQNPQIGTARITVSAASKKKFKLPSRTLGKGKLVNGNAGAGARVVPGAAMKKRLRALYKKWDAKGNPKWYVRATVTLRLTSPITETLTRSGRYELDSAVQGPIVGSKGDTYPCGGCNR